MCDLRVFRVRTRRSEPQNYQQGEGAVSRGGLGLGLAIAKHVVEAHGGTVEARSAGANRGATFVARLPLTAFVSAETSDGVNANRPERPVR
ncbi:MAG: ATP-binding protein [Acidobacteriota bacterium]